eukprot:jgi/Orpsp1_1/1192553/evm.model.d7180000094156.1
MEQMSMKKDIKGVIPLILALERYKKDDKIIKYLIDHDADVNNILLKKGNTFKDMIKHRANIIEIDDDDDDKAKFFSEALVVSMTDIDIDKFLIKNGLDVEKENKYENLPLTLACSRSDANIIYYLVDHGADVTQQR